MVYLEIFIRRKVRLFFNRLYKIAKTFCKSFFLIYNLPSEGANLSRLCSHLEFKTSYYVAAFPRPHTDDVTPGFSSLWDKIEQTPIRVGTRHFRLSSRLRLCTILEYGKTIHSQYVQGSFSRSVCTRRLLLSRVTAFLKRTK